jgi:Tfp pilus assembly protein PilX
MNNARIKTKNRATGFVLILTLFAAVLLATLIMGMASMTAVDAGLVKNHMYSMQAYYIAEAGAADAIDRIQQQGTLATTDWETFFPASPDKYTVSVTQGATTVITSTGLTATANFTRQLEIDVNISGASAPYAVSINYWKEVIQ